jgi:hypothetical protein
MNHTLETYLLSLIVPAIALMVFIFLERRSKVPVEVPERAKNSVAQPKFNLIPGRKR